ncbi:MAG TPA: acetyl-CoA carboxylase carboxyltransferase subunit alpha [Desulfitobacterium dehalogenans]|uniref:Acetyl-coenzyme A carboxylase carboxyl transferase subunit alpha n=1 Tax=Desulfitobacterium dehalogenans TaxID=36854 RepID=A0A7C7D3I4_9FIRM|nr:acetyl-CoA carboxylase carboxyltransferase subunit alpha [Desulfitobacterium dehalogenans]
MLEQEKDIAELSTNMKDSRKFAQEKKADSSAEITVVEAILRKMKSEAVMNLGPMDKLILSRMIERPTALDYIAKIFNGFIEFHGDRKFRDDPSIVGGIARLNDLPVTVIGQQKGRNTKENVRRNFGMSSPDGFRKALRLMKQAEKFRRPIICFVDTPGADPGIGAEERGQGEAIARNLMEMIDLRTPIISIVIGEGGSGGALALSIADEIWMLEHSVFAILSPEGFASILWKDASRAEEAAQLMKITAQELEEFGVIDKVLPEPQGGAHQDPDAMALMIKNSLLQVPFGQMIAQINEVVSRRYNKYRKIGAYME